jgi:multidrug efflux pump subunit AcrA (membrane-fusion protein)
MEGIAMLIQRLDFRFLFALLVFLVLVGCGGGQTERREAIPVPVEVTQAVRGPIEEFAVATGSIHPHRQVTLAVVTSWMTSLGPIKTLTVNVGDRVQEGDVLVEIDAGEIEARRLEAMARFQQAQAKCRELDSLEMERRAVAENALSEYRRHEELLSTKAISQSDFDRARAALEQATAVLQSVSAQRLQTQAQARSATASVAQMDWLIENATLRAPFDAVVSKRHAQQGDMAQPGLPILTLQDIDTVDVRLTVNEEDIDSVRIDAKVDMEVDAVAQRRFEGRVSRIDPSGDPLSHAFTVEVELRNPEHRLLPGMFARGHIQVAAEEEALLIPRSAVGEEGEQRFVWRVVEGIVERADVTLGLRQGDTWQVVDGVSEGEALVTRGRQNLTPGAAVRIMKPGREVEP